MNKCEKIEDEAVAIGKEIAKACIEDWQDGTFVVVKHETEDGDIYYSTNITWGYSPPLRSYPDVEEMYQESLEKECFEAIHFLTDAFEEQLEKKGLWTEGDEGDGTVLHLCSWKKRGNREYEGI